MMLRSVRMAIGVVAIALDACTATPQQRGREADVPGQTVSAAVTGTVSYRERMALPPTAVVKVQLLDVSFADVAATVLDSITLRPTAGQQVPYPFLLRYDPVQIDARNTYAVRASIIVDGKPLFTSTEAHPVITRGNPLDVNIMLQRVGVK
jgi:putative lipoprotein